MKYAQKASSRFFAQNFSVPAAQDFLYVWEKLRGRKEARKKNKLNQCFQQSKAKLSENQTKG